MSSAISGINATTPTSSAPVNSLSAMTPQDFLKLLITQLQYQDPTQPVTNSDLLNQVNAIGTLQTSTNLDTTLTGMGQQQQLASASDLIGKSVQGANSQNQSVTGTVSSVAVQSGSVYLNLVGGQQIALANVTQVSPVSAGSATTTGS